MNVLFRTRKGRRSQRGSARLQGLLFRKTLERFRGSRSDFRRAAGLVPAGMNPAARYPNLQSALDDADDLGFALLETDKKQDFVLPLTVPVPFDLHDAMVLAQDRLYGFALGLGQLSLGFFQLG